MSVTAFNRRQPLLGELVLRTSTAYLYNMDVWRGITS